MLYIHNDGRSKLIRIANKRKLFYNQAINCEQIKLEATYTNKTILRFELLSEVQCVIDQREASGLATSEVSPETKSEYKIRCNFVHLCKFRTNLGLWDCRLTWV